MNNLNIRRGKAERFRSRINRKIITPCVFYVHWSDTQLTLYSCNSPWSVKCTTQRKLPFKYIDLFASKLTSIDFKCKVAIVQEKLSILALKISTQKIKTKPVHNRFYCCFVDILLVQFEFQIVIPNNFIFLFAHGFILQDLIRIILNTKI